jgi:hypothetical protein
MTDLYLQAMSEMASTQEFGGFDLDTAVPQEVDNSNESFGGFEERESPSPTQASNPLVTNPQFGLTSAQPESDDQQKSDHPQVAVGDEANQPPLQLEMVSVGKDTIVAKQPSSQDGRCRDLSPLSDRFCR